MQCKTNPKKKPRLLSYLIDAFPAKIYCNFLYAR